MSDISDTNSDELPPRKMATNSCEIFSEIKIMILFFSYFKWFTHINC